MAAATSPFLVALDQCGLELQAPHMRTTTKRRMETADLDAATLPDDSLRFMGWHPQVMEAIFPGLNPEASYEIEAVYLCERDVDRVLSMTSGGLELHPPIELARGTATVIRVVVPPSAVVDGTLEVRVERVVGPDVVMSELRLFSSERASPVLTVVGDSRGGLIGTLGAPDYAGVPDAPVRVTGDAGTFEVWTDRAGVFRVPLLDGLSVGQHGRVTLATGSGDDVTERTVDTREIARGLRELPPASDRLDLGGEWVLTGGPFPASTTAGAPSTRVPGHIIYDALVPEDGIATFHRTFGLPETWSEAAMFLRCDGAYGRAEVYVNGSRAGAHGSGATSFDVDITPFLQPGENALAITLTEFTPYAVLDDMSWYAHMSLLGIWRDIFLFAVPTLHLSQLDLDADWDPETAMGTLSLGADVINLDPSGRGYHLDVTVRDGTGDVVHRASRRATVGGAAGEREAFVTEPLAVRPWSAEEPHLYDLDVSVGTEGGGAVTYHRRIGFRRVETRGNQLLVNGAPIRIRGVNRHDSRILKGRALSAEDMREDVVNLRRANVNAIRTSHYPPSPNLLDVCDEVGMFVFEQPPICFSGGFDDHHWTRTNEAAQLVPYLLEVTAETVRRDQGRCSVIVWDLGNESRWGSGFDAQLALVRSMDPSRPTTFSYDLNMLGDEDGNELVRKPPGERPDLRSYHYPGWDRTWQEDLEWLNSYQEPVVLDEYAPLFAPCLRGPGEGYGLAIDPGIRDYWGAGYQPFMAAALQDRGVLGGLIWGGFGEVFAIPLDLTIGQGAWAHLPVTDYIRTRDHYPAEQGVFRRGDGDWGIFDAWNRPRPELWHVHKMYSPVSVAAAEFNEAGDRLELTVENRFSHRSFDGLAVRASGGELPDGSVLTAGPGETARLVLRADPGSEVVRVEFWHPEGWLVDGYEWSWPAAAAPPDTLVVERAEALEIDLSEPGSLNVSSNGRRWLRGWPELHVLDVDMPHIPVPCPRTDGGEVVADGPDVARAPLASHDWHGSISARIEGRTVVFDYESTYLGSRAFNAKEVGLTLRPSRDLTDLWWRRVGEWSLYPPEHIGRTSGYAASAPGSNTTLDPAPTWEQDATAAGSNDYRSVKRSILVAGATDGPRSLTVLSDGSQHIRAELVDGSPELHVLDWYGGVRTLDGNHPIWSAYLGSGMPITTGTTLRGRVVLAAGERP